MKIEWKQPPPPLARGRNVGDRTKPKEHKTYNNQLLNALQTNPMRWARTERSAKHTLAVSKFRQDNPGIEVLTRATKHTKLVDGKRTPRVADIYVRYNPDKVPAAEPVAEPVLEDAPKPTPVPQHHEEGRYDSVLHDLGIDTPAETGEAPMWGEPGSGFRTR